MRGHLGHAFWHKGWGCVLHSSAQALLCPGTRTVTGHWAGHRDGSNSSSYKCWWGRARRNTQHRGDGTGSTSQQTESQNHRMV